MSTNFKHDIERMHDKYGSWHAVGRLNEAELRAFLEFRTKFLEEELGELKTAKSADDVVDALVDLVVVALGTLDLLQVDTGHAWNEVLRANMAKEVGIKPSRPNPLGLPDLVKPEGWEAPSHTDNVGLLAKIFKS